MAATEPQGKRTKREPTRMEKMETQLADLSSKLEQMMYGLTVIHQRFEQQPAMQAPCLPQQQQQQQQHPNLPDMTGGGRSKVTPAALAAVQGFEPDELLHLHEDEYTCTTEVPRIDTAAGIASITTVNVTSLRQQWEAVVALNSDIVCITEVRLDQSQQRSMADRMERAGYTVLRGSPPPTRISKRNREYLAWGGVAIAVKSHWSITEIVHPDGD
eukprot:6462659-Amphidinium_carterae.2